MGASGGHHHQWGAVAGATLSGAGSGALVGSAVPGIGTAIGAGVGAVGGFLGGLFGGDAPDDLPPPSAPPPPVDVADQIAQRAAMAKQQRLMATGSGAFLTGPLGDTSKVPGAPPAALAA